jgi:hypothetical protein
LGAPRLTLFCELFYFLGTTGNYLHHVNYFLGHRKIADFLCGIFIDNNIRGFLIAEYYSVRMQIHLTGALILGKCFQHIFEHLFPIKPKKYIFVILYDCPQISPRAIFVNNPIMVPGLIPVLKFQYVGVTQIVNNFDLGSLNTLQITSLNTRFLRPLSKDF